MHRLRPQAPGPGTIAVSCGRNKSVNAQCLLCSWAAEGAEQHGAQRDGEGWAQHQNFCGELCLEARWDFLLVPVVKMCRMCLTARVNTSLKSFQCQSVNETMQHGGEMLVKEEEQRLWMSNCPYRGEVTHNDWWQEGDEELQTDFFKVMAWSRELCQVSLCTLY